MNDNDILDNFDRGEWPKVLEVKSIWYVRAFIFLAAGGVAFWLEFFWGIILDILYFFE